MRMVIYLLVVVIVVAFLTRITTRPEELPGNIQPLASASDPDWHCSHTKLAARKYILHLEVTMPAGWMIISDSVHGRSSLTRVSLDHGTRQYARINRIQEKGIPLACNLFPRISNTQVCFKGKYRIDAYFSSDAPGKLIKIRCTILFFTGKNVREIDTSFTIPPSDSGATLPFVPAGHARLSPDSLVFRP